MGLRALRCALALSLLATGPAGAGAKEAYKDGVEAIEAGRWTDAERYFRAAIAERPEEKVTRLFNIAYLPHYYLGVALAELGQCRAALDAFAESTRQEQIQRSDHESDLSRRRGLCQDHVRRVEAAKREVDELLSRVGEAAAALERLSATPELAARWTAGRPSFGARQKSAEKKLSEARQRLRASDAGGELERLDAAKSLATSALTELNGTLADSRRRLGELNAAAAAALEQLEVVEQSARSLLRSISDLAPYRGRLGARVAAVRDVLEVIEEAKAGAGTQRMGELTTELTDVLAALRSAARRPPKKLSEAVAAYLSGSYEDALALLDDPDLDGDARTRPHACLLRAACRHGLWVLGGERDDALRELAVEAVTACGADPSTAAAGSEAPSLPLSSKFFSPRFVAFHDAAREAEARSAELDAPGGETAAAGGGADPAGDARPSGG